MSSTELTKANDLTDAIATKLDRGDPGLQGGLQAGGRPVEVGIAASKAGLPWRKLETLDKRRKSIRNIRKITRTMELIATARFKKAMDRATAATAYTKRITRLVADLAQSGLEVRHPLLEDRPQPKTSRHARAHRQSRHVRRIQFQRPAAAFEHHDATDRQRAGSDHGSLRHAAASRP